MGGAPAGDLFLEVHCSGPTRAGAAVDRDVYQPLPLAPWEAALGASVEVHTPAGSRGSDRARALPRRAQAAPQGPGHSPAARRGICTWKLDIALPPADTDAARAAWTALGKAFPHFNPRTLAQPRKEPDHAPCLPHPAADWANCWTTPHSRWKNWPAPAAAHPEWVSERVEAGVLETPRRPAQPPGSSPGALPAPPWCAHAAWPRPGSHLRRRPHLAASPPI
jgi:hypothetical protein